MKTFKGKLIETTNEKIKRFKNQELEFIVSNSLIALEDDDWLFRTSPIDEIDEENDIVHIKTLNSVYTIEKTNDR